jgi:hypothetical protein
MCSRGENLLTYFFVFSMHDATTRSSLIKHKINIERKKKKNKNLRLLACCKLHHTNEQKNENKPHIMMHDHTSSFLANKTEILKA